MNPAKDDPGAVSVRQLTKHENRVRAARTVFDRWLQGEIQGVLFLTENGVPRIVQMPHINFGSAKAVNP